MCTELPFDFKERKKKRHHCNKRGPEEDRMGLSQFHTKSPGGEGNVHQGVYAGVHSRTPPKVAMETRERKRKKQKKIRGVERTTRDRRVGYPRGVSHKKRSS
ncbi:hypothetical protein TNCV_4040471 [Trichonephila clavipes]|nr:hypothetical protein TNCV_4040471 [Trichonephila clavipes]